MNNSKFLWIFASVLLAALTRFLPHPPNFTAIGAIALFSGFQLKDKKLALFIPLAILLFTDLFVGFHNTMLAVYLGFALTTLLGISMKNAKQLTIVGMSITSSILFFVITNFAVWASADGFYSNDLTGLGVCYSMALPFFANSIIGDLCFNALLFGALYFANNSFLVKERVSIKK